MKAHLLETTKPRRQGSKIFKKLEDKFQYKILKLGQPGWLSGLAPPSVQGVILKTQDGVLRQTP